MSKRNTVTEDLKEHLAMEYFAGFDDLDELFERVAKTFGVDAAAVEILYNEMTQNDEPLE